MNEKNKTLCQQDIGQKLTKSFYSYIGNIYIRDKLNSDYYTWKLNSTAFFISFLLEYK